MADDTQAKPNFDFIMKQEPKPNKPFAKLLALPKPVLIGGAAFIAFVFILIFSAIFSGGGNVPSLYSLLSDTSTITTACEEAEFNAKKVDTRNVSATAKNLMLSQKQQMTTYLQARKIKVNQKLVQSRLDAKTQLALQTAQQNNAYDAAFITYLKSAILKYQSDLKAVNLKASPSLKAILADAYSSNAELLKDKTLQ